jgi:N-acylneuraminate cytidylyltransferase
MNNVDDILVVIPARGGSKGIPMKNIKPLNGKPLIKYSIEFALKHFKKEQIVVSTDHKDIQRVAQSCGIPTPTLRPNYLAQDDSSTHDVLLDIIKQKKAEGFNFKRILLLQPTSPFRTSKHLLKILEMDMPNIDMIASVKEAKSTPLIFGVVLFYLADLQNMGTRIASAMIFFVIYIVFAALIKNQGFIYIQNTIKEMKISLNKNVSIE